jgi:hypothetical protein
MRVWPLYPQASHGSSFQGLTSVRHDTEKSAGGARRYLKPEVEPKLGERGAALQEGDKGVAGGGLGDAQQLQQIFFQLALALRHNVAGAGSARQEQRWDRSEGKLRIHS